MVYTDYINLSIHTLIGFLLHENEMKRNWYLFLRIQQDVISLLLQAFCSLYQKVLYY